MKVPKDISENRTAGNILIRREHWKGIIQKLGDSKFPNPPLPTTTTELAELITTTARNTCLK
jgi:hypothetical protein